MSAIAWEHVARGTLHPLQVAALERAASVEEFSPGELSRDLQVELTHVSYHVRALAKRGLLTATRHRPRRGAIEHFYALAPEARGR